MRKILFRENTQSFSAPAGYSVISYKGGQMVVSDFRRCVKMTAASRSSG